MTDLAGDGQTMIVVTHSMRFARRTAHTVHVFEDGRVLERGPPEQIFDASAPRSHAAVLGRGRREVAAFVSVVVTLRVTKESPWDYQFTSPRDRGTGLSSRASVCSVKTPSLLPHAEREDYATRHADI